MEGLLSIRPPSCLPCARGGGSPNGGGGVVIHPTYELSINTIRNDTRTRRRRSSLFFPKTQKKPPSFRERLLSKNLLTVELRMVYLARSRKGGYGLFLRKEVVAMVTYPELFAFCVLLVAIVDLCLSHKKK